MRTVLKVLAYCVAAFVLWVVVATAQIIANDIAEARERDAAVRNAATVGILCGGNSYCIDSTIRQQKLDAAVDKYLRSGR